MERLRQFVVLTLDGHNVVCLLVVHFIEHHCGLAHIGTLIIKIKSINITYIVQVFLLDVVHHSAQFVFILGNALFQ